jgi:hypothetical protein
MRSLEVELANELPVAERTMVRLGDELRQRVLQLFADDKSVEQVKSWLSGALIEAAKTLPAPGYTVELKGRREGLTDKAKERVFEGGFFGVGNPFKVSADIGAQRVELPFESDWHDVRDELGYYKARTKQLQTELAKLSKGSGDNKA